MPLATSPPFPFPGVLASVSFTLEHRMVSIPARPAEGRSVAP